MGRDDWERQHHFRHINAVLSVLGVGCRRSEFSQQLVWGARERDISATVHRGAFFCMGYGFSSMHACLTHSQRDEAHRNKRPA